MRMKKTIITLAIAALGMLTRCTGNSVSTAAQYKVDAKEITQKQDTAVPQNEALYNPYVVYRTRNVLGTAD